MKSIIWPGHLIDRIGLQPALHDDARIERTAVQIVNSITVLQRSRTRAQMSG